MPTTGSTATTWKAGDCASIGTSAWPRSRSITVPAEGARRGAADTTIAADRLVAVLPTARLVVRRAAPPTARPAALIFPRAAARLARMAAREAGRRQGTRPCLLVVRSLPEEARAREVPTGTSEAVRPHLAHLHLLWTSAGGSTTSVELVRNTLFLLSSSSLVMHVRVCLSFPALAL